LGRAKEVVPLLEADDLSLSTHGEVFGAVAALVEQGETAFDVWTLASELRHRGTLESVGGIAYLADLDTGVLVKQNLGLRVRRLKDLAQRRHLLRVCEELLHRLADLSEPLLQTKTWLLGILNELR
jgi:replicative DNA helicase